MWSSGNDAAVRIAFTPGEPAGIGPDLIAQLASEERKNALLAIADPEVLAARAEQLGLPLQLKAVVEPEAPLCREAGCLSVLPIQAPVQVRPGRLEKGNAPYVLECLRRGTELCQMEHCQALVTGPVHKGILVRAGIPFRGHTEFLAEITGTETPVMLLAAGDLRVALATTHLPLREVPAAITRDGLEQRLRVLHRGLQMQFGIAEPRILVAGLNPHAGEDGSLGREEIEIISPCLEALRAEGMDLRGPLAADTLFRPAQLAETDAVFAMYHDQGLPVLKHVGFGRAVNITLGLPILRVSVDHGTALDCAGKGGADAGSLRAALRMAAELAGQQRPHE